MDAIEAVLDLAKERDELAHELEVYESWFESLVGRTATLRLKKSKNSTNFVEGKITEFVEGEGWDFVGDVDDQVFSITFDDFFTGKVHMHK